MSYKKKNKAKLYILNLNIYMLFNCIICALHTVKYYCVGIRKLKIMFNIKKRRIRQQSQYI